MTEEKEIANEVIGGDANLEAACNGANSGTVVIFFTELLAPPPGELHPAFFPDGIVIGEGVDRRFAGCVPYAAGKKYAKENLIKFCPKCGQSLDEGQQICTCGFDIVVARKVEETTPPRGPATAGPPAPAAVLSKPRPISPQVGSGKRYDPAIIQTFANRLYRVGTGITIVLTFIGIVIGVSSGSLVGMFNRDWLAVGVVLSGLFWAGAGYFVGRRIAFVFQLRAQLALCQVEIERNLKMLLEKQTRF